MSAVSLNNQQLNVAPSDLSILQNVAAADVQSDPYPHLVLQNALPEELYNALSESYPGADKIVSPTEMGNNKRYQISAHVGLTSPDLTPLWQEFMRFHVSQAFWNEVIVLFGDQIRALYPWLESAVGRSLDQMSVGVRNVHPERDVVLDCQPGINSPVTRQTSVRGPHLDNPKELFGALLYLREEHDDSTGGDLEIYRYRKTRGMFYGKAEISHRQTERVATVRYQRNTLVFFLNSYHSLHGVTPRSVTSHCRRLVNFIGELYNLEQKTLFQLEKKRRWREYPTAALRRLGIC